jgi:hypothetical protein
MKERAMQHITTTATAAEKLKRQAKALRKSTGTSLAVALDNLAKQNGYEHWKHVTECLENTRNAPKQPLGLPDEMTRVLETAAQKSPAMQATQNAFVQGFVFAMDVKDASEINPGPDFTECPEGWYLAARDIWSGFIHYVDEESGLSIAQTQSVDQILESAIEDLSNYRFMRYVGQAQLATLADAYKRVSEISFFPPTHIWLHGVFTDLREIPEIQVDGKVVLKNYPGSIKMASNPNPPVRVQPLHALRFTVDRLQPSLYLGAIWNGGVEVTAPSHYDSIEEAIREMAGDVPEGFAQVASVSYAGATSPLLALSILIEHASGIAQTLVEESHNSDQG